MAARNNLETEKPLGLIHSVCSVKDRELLRATVATTFAGISLVPEQENPRVVIHAGPSVRVACRRGGDHNDGIANYGDIDIIPARMSALWEIYGEDRALLLGISQNLLDYVAESSGMRPADTELQNRFQIRNLQIEHIGWSVKAEMEQGNPGGRIYMESMATALAVEILHNRGRQVTYGKAVNGRLSSRRLKQILSYIDENIGDDLTLRAIADELQISISLLKDTFRKSVGVSLHQYIIRRRVERAADLLTNRRLPIKQVAVDTGFAHQSHMTMHMRRFLGVSPKELQNNSLGD